MHDKLMNIHNYINENVQECHLQHTFLTHNRIRQHSSAVLCTDDNETI